jgi:hypothetical protein
VYNIPLGGGMFRQPWAIGGSGSTYIYGYCDATFEEGWGEDRTVQFVKDCEFGGVLALLLLVLREKMGGTEERSGSVDMRSSG